MERNETNSCAKHLQIFFSISLKPASANGSAEVMDRLKHFERAEVHDRVCAHNWLEQLRNFIQYACQISC